MWSHIIATMLFSWVEFQLKNGNFSIFWHFSLGLSKCKLSLIFHKFISVCQKLKSNGSFGNQKSRSLQLCPNILTLSASGWVEFASTICVDDHFWDIDAVFNPGINFQMVQLYFRDVYTDVVFFAWYLQQWHGFRFLSYLRGPNVCW